MSFFIANKTMLRKSLEEYLAPYSEFSFARFKRELPDISTWDVSGITDMSDLFHNLIVTPYSNSRLAGINSWNVSNVTDMSSMFYGCSEFNQPLNRWNVSNVKNMNSMFKKCFKFNKPLNEWNVSNVTDMNEMFAYCSSFNQDLTGWKFSDIPRHNKFSTGSNMKSSFLPIFEVEEKQLPNIIFTDIGDLRSAIMDYLITNQSNFPQISQWNVSGINNMAELFSGLIITPQDNNKLKGIGNWDVRNVTDMIGMFSGCSAFNQPIETWDVSNVKDMTSMFYNCTLFNQPLNEWNVSSVSEMSRMFYGCTSFNQPLNKWDVSSVEDMSGMFEECVSFNQNLRSWRVPFVETIFGFSTNSGLKSYNRPFFPISEEEDEDEEDEEDEEEEEEYDEEEQKADITAENKTKERDSESIIRTFYDFEEFIAFFNTQVCPTGGTQLPDGTFNVDDFCHKTSQQLTIDNFTTDVPPELSLLSIDPSIYETSQTPFYTAIKYVNTKIGRFKLTYKLKNYMILLNRLIYYYNIFLLIKNHKLNGFNDSTGIIIYSHGGYIKYDESDIVPLERPIENVFICNKATPGCATYSYDFIIESDIKYPNSTIHVMTDNIEKKGFVNFDQSVFRIDVPDINPLDESRQTAKMVPSIIANPHKNRRTFGIEMQHYILPRSDVYINKTYMGKDSDNTFFVFDLEELKKFYQDEETNIRTYGTNIFYHPYNILNLPLFQHKTITNKYGRIKIHFNMKNIMDYCKEKGKPNVFIYDTSCGVIGDISQKDYEEIIIRVNQSVEKGFGRRLFRAKNKTKKARKTHKKKNSQRKQKTKNNKKQNKTTNKRK